jgi:hypothetical protein
VEEGRGGLVGFGNTGFVVDNPALAFIINEGAINDTMYNFIILNQSDRIFSVMFSVLTENPASTVVSEGFTDGFLDNFDG